MTVASQRRSIGRRTRVRRLLAARRRCARLTRQPGQPRANCSFFSSWSSDSGSTDSREIRISGLVAKPGSALSSVRVTGRSSRRSAMKSTQTRFPAGSVGSGYGARATRASPTAALSLCEWYTTTVSPTCMLRRWIWAWAFFTPSHSAVPSRSRSAKLYSPGSLFTSQAGITPPHSRPQVRGQPELSAPVAGARSTPRSEGLLVGGPGVRRFYQRHPQPRVRARSESAAERPMDPAAEELGGGVLAGQGRYFVKVLVLQRRQRLVQGSPQQADIHHDPVGVQGRRQHLDLDFVGRAVQALSRP